MSIFVSNEIFSFKLICKRIISNDDRVIGYKIDNNGDIEIECFYTGRSFNKMSKVIEDSSIINSATGKPLLRTSVLCRQVVSNFVKKIVVTNGESIQTFDINNENINNIQYDLIKEITKKWLEITSGK